MKIEPLSPMDAIDTHFARHKQVLEQTWQKLRESIAQVALLIAERITTEHKLILCGNGGSAADAQHIAAELIGRYSVTRRALPAIALTTDTSALTAIGNDFGFDEIFSRQVEGLARKGDVVLGISTSGNSKNVLEAMKTAHLMKCTTV